MPDRTTDWAADIKALRAKFGLSQSQCAEFLWDMPIKTLQHWEGGRAAPGEWVQRAIREKFTRALLSGRAKD